MFGLLVHLEVVRLLGMTEGPLPPLAIASCGNAALAAAVVAAAGRRRLLVFVPTDAEPAVLDRLRALGAEITVCPREDGVAGDPTYHRLQAAIADGALPFTCQGNENGLAIEGGVTLGYEMAAALVGQGRLDHVVIQVGGGALASAVAQGLSESAAFGVLPGMPRVHTVQTAGAWPLARAFERVAARLAGRARTRRDSRSRAVRRRTPVRVHVALGDRAPQPGPWHPRRRDLRLGGGRRGDAQTGGQALVVNEDEIAQANGTGGRGHRHRRLTRPVRPVWPAWPSSAVEA